MQINKATFPAVFPHFKELLSTCDFYAFDEEMTGISCPEMAENATFVPEQSYGAKREVASRYGIIQVGICLFHRVGISAAGGVVKYAARPFNFTVFPDQTDAQREITGLREFSLSPSAISFLRRNHMDFQAWMYDGISYCDERHSKLLELWFEKECAQQRGEADVAENENTNAPLSADELQWVAESFETAKRLQSLATAAGTDDCDPSRVEKSESLEAALPSQTSRLAQQQLASRIRTDAPNVLLDAFKKGTCRLKALTEKELEKRKAKEELWRARRYYDLLGFRLAFNALVESRKPCVGHNCFADILFLLSSLDAPLPHTLCECKKRIQALFPRIYDTKYLSTRSTLCNANLLQSNYLGGLFSNYGLNSGKVAIELPLGFQSYDTISLLGSGRESSKNPAHEAGYDALMTGAVFLNIIHDAGYTFDTAPQACENKIALYGSLFALNLSSATDEYLPEGYKVISVQHPSGMQRDVLIQHMVQLKGQETIVYSISNSQALVVVPPSLDAEYLKKNFLIHCKGIKNTFYSPLQLPQRRYQCCVSDWRHWFRKMFRAGK